MKPSAHRARSRPLMFAQGELRGAAPVRPLALARPLAVVPAGHRHPVSWTAYHQSSAGKFAAAWGSIGILTLLAFLSHCAHPIGVMLLWLLGS